LAQVLPLHPAEHDNLQKDSESGHKDEGHREGEQPVAGPVGDDEAEVSAEEIERAMRQVDVAHQTEDQREPAGDEEIEPAEGDPVEEGVEKDLFLADQIDQPGRPEGEYHPQQHRNDDQDDRAPIGVPLCERPHSRHLPMD